MTVLNEFPLHRGLCIKRKYLGIRTLERYSYQLVYLQSPNVKSESLCINTAAVVTDVYIVSKETTRSCTSLYFPNGGAA